MRPAAPTDPVKEPAYVIRTQIPVLGTALCATVVGIAVTVGVAAGEDTGARVGIGVCDPVCTIVGADGCSVAVGVTSGTDGALPFPGSEGARIYQARTTAMTITRILPATSNFLFPGAGVFGFRGMRGGFRNFSSAGSISCASSAS